jgi:predicted ATPase with chaperone activity
VRRSKHTALVTTRPFRASHHTVSDVGLIGGGHVPTPGEVLLAHHDVLFLDERPEFRRHAFEVLRQPLEKRTIDMQSPAHHGPRRARRSVRGHGVCGNRYRLAGGSRGGITLFA